MESKVAKPESKKQLRSNEAVRLQQLVVPVAAAARMYESLLKYEVTNYKQSKIILKFF